MSGWGGGGIHPMIASFSVSVHCGPLYCWASAWLLVAAGWNCGWGIGGPTEKLQNACPSAELGNCGGCLCCCQTCCSSPSICACLSCFSFFSSMSNGQMVWTAMQKVIHMSCELLTSAFSVGGSCCWHPTTKRLLLSGIAFASFSIE